MAKFNVGDVVTVRSDLEVYKQYGCNDVVEDMLKYCGKEVEITDVFDRGYKIKNCTVWTWTDEMFEEGKEEEKMPKFKVGDVVRIKDEFDYDLVDNEVGYVDEFEAYHGKIATITYVSCRGNYNIDIDDENYNWHESQFEFATPTPDNTIKFAKLRKDVIIPSKREEDGAFDIYANFEEDYMIIKPHETKMIPTGLYSAFSTDYVAILKERGSTGTKGMGQRAGVVDSGYRGEWFVPITNHNDKPIIIAKNASQEGGYTFIKGEGMIGYDTDYIIYPYSKAISQVIMIPVPKLSIEEVTVDEIMAISSERGTGCLGSSQK